MSDSLSNLDGFLRDRAANRDEPSRRRWGFRDFCNVAVLPVFAELRAAFESSGKDVAIYPPDEGDDEPAARLVVRGKDEPDFEYHVWARIAPGRALVMERYTELDVDEFPPVSRNPTRFQQQLFVPDVEGRLNDARTITADEARDVILRNVNYHYQALMSSLRR